MQDILEWTMDRQNLLQQQYMINKGRTYRPTLTPEQWVKLPDAYHRPNLCTSGNPSGNPPPPLLLQGR